MRISDWSSDVCSSDLVLVLHAQLFEQAQRKIIVRILVVGFTQRIAQVIIAALAGQFKQAVTALGNACRQIAVHEATAHNQIVRSEERRVGKEWVSRGRSRWAP